jgi:hypothetical protein
VSRLVIGTDVIRVERQRAGLHQAEHHHVRAVLRVDMLTDSRRPRQPLAHQHSIANITPVLASSACRSLAATPGKVTIAACTSMSTPNDGQ